MTTRSARRAIAATALATLALTACSGGDAETKDSASAPSSSKAPTSGATDEDADELAAEAAKGGIDPSSPPKPIVSATAPAVIEGDPKASMKVDVLRLKRQGKTVIANYAFTVTSPAGVDKADWLYGYLGDKSWDSALIDSTNLKKHNVVKADGAMVATAHQGPQFRPGQTYYAYAVYAAPPESIKTMDVLAANGVPAFPGVPLS